MICISFLFNFLTLETTPIHSRAPSINWFFSCLFFTFRAPFLVTIAAKPKQLHSKDKENVSANDGNRAIVAVSMVQKPPAVIVNKPTMLKNILKKSLTVPSAAASSSSAVVTMKASAGSSKGELKKETKSASVQSLTVAKKAIGQRQFEYAEAQKKRRELLIQKLKEQEEKEMKFNFHANPAPKFKKVVLQQKQMSLDSRKVAKQNSMPHIPIARKASNQNLAENNVPSCGDPDRLKYFIEKKKLLAAKYQETHVQFKAKPAMVLKKQPFQPVHNNVKVADPKPFKLQLTERLLQRSEFDKKLHETIAIRKKQEEIRQRQQAFEDRKLIRQKTEFRARANPFRNYH